MKCRLAGGGEGNSDLETCFKIMMIIYFLSFFFLFKAEPAAYGDSQARGRIGAVATGLRQSHSNSGTESRLQPTPQLTATQDPQPTERGQGSTRNLMAPSRICFRCATMGAPDDIL